MSAPPDSVLAAQPPPAHQRLSNAGTLPRFVLLIVLFVGIAAVITASLVEAHTDPNGARVGCGLAAGGDPGLSDLDVRFRIVDQQSAFEDCVDRFVPAQPWWWKPAALLLVSVCAAALYWALPRWKGRRSRVVPVEQVDGHADLVSTLAELVTVAGLRRPPRFVIAPAVPTSGAVVFGRLRRYTVCLDGGLVARRHRAPEGFRAVVLHELAHLRNRDVDITYATVALWRILLWVVVPLDLAYIAAVSLPSTAGSSMATREQSRVAHHVAMLAVTVVLVYLARADILRTREFHADLTARRWGADVRLWETAAGRDATGRAPSNRIAAGRLMASWASLWHTHPSWERRLRSLADPGTVFAPQALPFFLTGATAAIAATRMPALLSLLGIASHWENWVVAVVVAVLVSTITGLLLWPAVTHAALTHGPAPSGLRAGCWLGGGLIVGELAVGRSGSVWDLLPEQAAFLVPPVLAGLAAVWWTTEYAQVSATRPAGVRRRWPLLVGLGVSCLVLALWWHWWEAQGAILAGGFLSFNGDLVGAHEQSLTDGQGYEGPLLALAPGLPVLLALSKRPELLWASGALWVLPLLAWLPRSAGATRPRPVLPAAGTGALCSAVAVVAATAGVRAWSPVVAGREQAHLVSYTMWLMVVVIGVMWLAAGVTAALAERYPLVQALVVAGATGLAGLLTLAALASVDGCVRPLTILASSCQPDPLGGWSLVTLLTPTTLGLGGFLAVAVAALGTLAGRSLRRIRARAGSTPLAGDDSPVPAHLGRLALRRAAVVVPCLLMTATTIAVTVADLRSATRTPAASAALDPVLGAQATSPGVRTAQVEAWRALGGDERGGQVLTVVLGLLHRLDQLAADGSDRVLSDWTLIDAEVRPRCAAISERVAGARRYFRHPDPQGQAAWNALLTRAERAGGDCDLAIGRRDRDGYLTAIRRLVSLGQDVPGMGEAIFR
ncbi:heat shock protein HtpX [Micromonospora sp. MW-13]|uniref:M48 family metalloprotease n=1 Tax=Micromonospora sp. MW-13 TaxID=2094022 RepID=UPI000E4327B8|nr:M48 family metalloprotease [Micromonospora sp. MW-13]RGC69366.1 heat shock protein HtpX [Micromonospora sp. MW-13]